MHLNAPSCSKDGAATLTAITAHAIFMAQDYFPKKARHWLICGGGRKNKILIEKIRLNLKSNFNLDDIDNYGLDGDFIESQAFAFLAIRTVLNLPLTFPNTTGCSKPLIGGEIIYT